MRRLLCSLFGHRRDAKRARPSFDGWRSSCTLCGARMVRVAPGNWCLAADFRQPVSRVSETRLWRRALRRRSDYPRELDRSGWGIRDLFD
ncbi:MAG: hypothetical protein ABIT69_00075 [Sphingomicrobium sp.]